MTQETRGNSFDELAKGLASGQVSRRKALKWMATAALGGTLFSIPGVAWGTPRTPPSGKGGCTGGRTLCRGRCYNLQTDRNNCGQCGNVCSETETCLAGSCCATAKVCGGVCCAAGETCITVLTGTGIETQECAIV